MRTFRMDNTIIVADAVQSICRQNKSLSISAGGDTFTSSYDSEDEAIKAMEVIEKILEGKPAQQLPSSEYPLDIISIECTPKSTIVADIEDEQIILTLYSKTRSIELHIRSIHASPQSIAEELIKVLTEAAKMHDDGENDNGCRSDTEDM